MASAIVIVWARHLNCIFNEKKNPAKRYQQHRIRAIISVFSEKKKLIQS